MFASLKEVSPVDSSVIVVHLLFVVAATRQSPHPHGQTLCWQYCYYCHCYLYHCHMGLCYSSLFFICHCSAHLLPPPESWLCYASCWLLLCSSPSIGEVPCTQFFFLHLTFFIHSWFVNIILFHRGSVYYFALLWSMNMNVKLLLCQ